MPPSGRTLQTTTTSLEILDVISRSEGARMDDIADELGVAESTVHAHLSTLHDAEYVVKEGHEYQLGLKLFHLGQRARHRKPEYGVVRKPAHELSLELNEEVSFAVAEHGRSVIVFDENADPTTEGFQVGRYFYMHSSASGKAILAELPRERVDRIIDRWGLPQQTDRTIGSRAKLHEELEATRERGYSVNRQEALEGLTAFGMAVHNPDGSVLGSLDVSGPPYRLSAEDVVDPLERTVATVEAELAEMTAGDG
jgi:IclR family acetate operon transcriptional repressor